MITMILLYELIPNNIGTGRIVSLFFLFIHLYKRLHLETSVTDSPCLVGISYKYVVFKTGNFTSAFSEITGAVLLQPDKIHLYFQPPLSLR